MPYQHWSEDAEDMASLSWTPIREMMQCISKCQSLNFSIVAQRHEALNLMTQVVHSAPFDIDSQFPEHKLYVCLSRGGWPTKYTQVIEALNFKETQLEKKEQSKMNSKGNDPRSGFYSGDDALHAYHQGLTSMVNEIANRDEVWGRGSLTTRLGIVWAG